MEIKDRIKIIMERENMAPGAFAESIHIQQSTLSHILNGRNNPSLDVIMKIHQRYSDIKLEWLLYGEGNMTAEQQLSSASPTPSDYIPSLFDENPIIASNEPSEAKNRKEMALGMPKNDTKEIVKQEIRYIERPPRKITEIRIFFDDNTYETFKGEK
ncbi:helix-turn-helix domain-containing protein [Bacteroides sp.]